VGEGTIRRTPSRRRLPPSRRGARNGRRRRRPRTRSPRRQSASIRHGRCPPATRRGAGDFAVRPAPLTGDQRDRHPMIGHDRMQDADDADRDDDQKFEAECHRVESSPCARRSNSPSIELLQSKISRTMIPAGKYATGCQTNRLLHCRHPMDALQPIGSNLILRNFRIFLSENPSSC
jgi:hypothetical protein